MASGWTGWQRALRGQWLGGAAGAPCVYVKPLNSVGCISVPVEFEVAFCHLAEKTCSP